MFEIEKLAILPGLVAAMLAYWSTPLVIKFAWKTGLIDDPKKNKHPKVIHKKPTPRAGGLAIFIAITATSLIFLPIDKHIVAILAGGLMITLLGLADDKWNLNPYLRLISQFIIASIPIIAGIGIGFISNPLGGVIELSTYKIIPDIIALFWIVAIMNFLNLGAKGVDGQLPGVAAVAAITLAIFSLRFSADITQWPVIILASITAGAFIGFLPFNVYPQKIMPGFSGSNLAGYFLAVGSILATAKVGILTVVLGVILVDTGYTFIRRVSSGKSPFWGDDKHLHHRLLRAGWSKPRVAAFYWLVTAILGILALNLNTQSKLYTMIAITFFVGGTILWLTYRPKKTYHQR